METVRALGGRLQEVAEPYFLRESSARGQQDPEGTICMMGPSGRDPHSTLPGH